VDNFLRTYEILRSASNFPEEKRVEFRQVMMKLSRDRPEIFSKLWSDDSNESAQAIQWLKDRHNELAKEFSGVEPIE
jgi:hypothetical protein